MTNHIYFLFLVIYLLIIMVNYNLLKHPKPYPPKEIREEFKRGRERLSSYKYRGLSHYLLPRLVKSKSNWVNGNAYWYRSSIKLGIFGIVISLLAMILGEVYQLYDYLLALLIIVIPPFLGMAYMCYSMEKKVLED